jgi:hypothetical protein
VVDIFVSYTSSDRDWANWIGLELEKLDHVARLHEWEISAGGNIPAWMEERHQKADHVLFVISKLYLTKDYSNWERLSAEWAAVSKRPGFGLPVFIEECETPTLLGAVQKVRPLRTKRGGGTGAAYRIFDASEEANGSAVSGREETRSR